MLKKVFTPLVACSLFAVFLNVEGEGEKDIVKKQVTEKRYIGAQEFLEESFKLAELIFKSNFRPTFLIALWRGGAPVGMIIDEYFSYKNVSIGQHLAVRVSAYNHDKLKDSVKVFNLDYVIKNIKKNDSLLIVDDIVDSGASMEALLKELKVRCGKDMPHDIKIASVYYKPKTSSIVPDYYLYAVNEWLVFPHEIEGLTIDEIKTCKVLELE